MASHIITDTPLPPQVLAEISRATALAEIPNMPESVREHIYHNGYRDKTTNKLRGSMLFSAHQTGRHGPQNGFRLCLVHRKFHIVSPERESNEEDDIDRMEKPIPQGHMEVFILGEEPAPETEIELSS